MHLHHLLPPQVCGHGGGGLFALELAWTAVFCLHLPVSLWPALVRIVLPLGILHFVVVKNVVFAIS